MVVTNQWRALGFWAVRVPATAKCSAPDLEGLRRGLDAEVPYDRVTAGELPGAHPDGRAEIDHEGAALGANSTIVCGTTVGEWAMVAAGSVVTKDVPDHALVRGNPARVVGYVFADGDTAVFEGDVAVSKKTGEKLVRGKDGVVRRGE